MLIGSANVMSDDRRLWWNDPSCLTDRRGYVIAPPSKVEVGGVMRTYAVIAVTTRPTRPVDAIELRRFLEPTRRIPAPARLQLNAND